MVMWVAANDFGLKVLTDLTFIGHKQTHRQAKYIFPENWRAWIIRTHPNIVFEWLKLTEHSVRINYHIFFLIARLGILFLASDRFLHQWDHNHNIFSLFIISPFLSENAFSIKKEKDNFVNKKIVEFFTKPRFNSNL